MVTAFETPQQAAECSGKFVDFPKLAAWASEVRSAHPSKKKETWRLEFGNAWIDCWEGGPRILVPGFEFVARRVSNAGALRIIYGRIPSTGLLTDAPTEIPEDANLDPTYSAEVIGFHVGTFLDVVSAAAKKYLDRPVKK